MLSTHETAQRQHELTTPNTRAAVHAKQFRKLRVAVSSNAQVFSVRLKFLLEAGTSEVAHLEMWPRLDAICPKALSSVNRCQHHLTQILRHQNHSNAKGGLNFAHGANITTTWTRWTIVMLRKQDSNQRLMLSNLISRSAAGGWWVASTFHNGRQKRFHIICRLLKKKHKGFTGFTQSFKFRCLRMKCPLSKVLKVLVTHGCFATA